jgi:uncharacterized protein
MPEIAPVSASERIDILDTTRGIAVLGILILNIAGFGLPYAYENPSNWGGDDGRNLFAWRVASLFFEGTMRGLFTLLFGAGVVLFVQRHRERNPDAPVAKLYYRRTFWLIVFGLINGYVLLWEGDILVYYGLTGLVLYFFRNLAPRALIVCALVAFLAQWSVTAYEYVTYRDLKQAAEIAQRDYYDGEDLTLEDEAILNEYADLRGNFAPAESQIEGTMEEIRRSYSSAFRFTIRRTFYVQTSYLLEHGIGDVLSFMLLGMALLKLGVLTGEAARRTYVRMVLAGYSCGLIVNGFEMVSFERSGFSVDALMRSYLTYDLGRLFMTLGHIGLIMLLYQRGLFVKAQRVLGAVGRMALTNYLAQSAICLFVFTGAGLALYGQLERYELYYVVFAIWLAQLVWSPLWLKYFPFGPAEWVWRKLTYGRGHSS